MSQNDAKKDPDFYNKVYLKDYDTLDKATLAIKSMVLDADESYAKHVNNDLVRPFFLNEHKRKMPLSTLKNPFIRRIKAKIEISQMEEWYGVMLGSLDNKRYNQSLDTVKGQSRLFLSNDGEIKKFSHYGSHIGPSGSQMIPSDLTLSHIRVKPNNWTNKETGKVRKGWNGMLIESSDDIPISELKTRLFGHAMEITELDESMKYQSVLIRGTIGMVSPVDNWNETEELVPDEKNGEEQYVRNDDGTYKTHPQTGAKIIKMKYKREKDGVGKPLKQCKHGTEETQWVFKVSLFNVDGESDNRVSVQFQQTRLGSAHILMQSADLVLNDAASLPVGGSEDPFTSLHNMWSGKEVVIAGTIISANTYQDSIWYGINGTIMMDEELTKTLAPPIEMTPVSESMPEIVAETREPHAEVTYGPEPENQPVYGPTTTAEMVYPSGIKEKTSTPIVVSGDKDTELLDRTIINAIAMMGDDIDYDMLMSISVGMPDKFKDPLQELPVRKALDRIRKEHLAAKTIDNIPKEDVITEKETPSVTTDTTKSKPSERLPPEKLLAEIGIGSDDIEVVSNPDDEKVPPGYIKCACGEMMLVGEVEKHVCKQK